MSDEPTDVTAFEQKVVVVTCGGLGGGCDCQGKRHHDVCRRFVHYTLSISGSARSVANQASTRSARSISVTAVLKPWRHRGRRERSFDRSPGRAESSVPGGRRLLHKTNDSEPR